MVVKMEPASQLAFVIQLPAISRTIMVHWNIIAMELINGNRESLMILAVRTIHASCFQAITLTKVLLKHVLTVVLMELASQPKLAVILFAIKMTVMVHWNIIVLEIRVGRNKNFMIIPAVTILVL